MSELQVPPRPEPPRTVGDTARRWLAWFGLGRLVLAAVSVLVVVGGLAWLVRSEPPPVEASLPLAAGISTSSSTTSTSVAPGPTTVAGRAVVHVAGAVRAPGVYQLDGTARVDDAVRAAGGPVGDADLDGLNLAARLVDGQRIYVPVRGEVDPASVSDGVPTAAGTDAPVGPVDLNTATAAELEALPGVGPATAASIVDDRERNGPFALVDDLDRVAGIGPAKLAALRDLVTV
ncbi:MAG: helix-hairpin-helix domain-containing protein [Acidimicrobiia bacterium]